MVRPRPEHELSVAAAPVVLLAGPGDATAVVYHALERAFGDVTLVQEDPVSHVALARRRAKRLGWPSHLR